jgi:cytoskeletal protein CcmA (bactofilin family)
VSLHTEKVVENKNISSSGGAPIAVTEADPAKVSSTQTAGGSGDVPGDPGPSTAPTPTSRHSRLKRRYVIAAILLAAVLLIGVVAVLLAMRSKNNVSNLSNVLDPQQVAQKYSPLTVSLDDLAQSGNLSIDGTPSLAVNGQLRVNNSLVLSATSQPKNAVAGQLYYDTGSNLLRYYDGAKFNNLLTEAETVQSIGGVQGNISLGGNLSIVNGVLSTTNSGVLTIQGQSGDIQLTSGGGIAIDGTTLTNTGVTSLGGASGGVTLGSGLAVSGGVLRNSGVNSLSAGTPDLTVTSDGQGNLTISNVGGGSGTVSSPGGTAGRIAKFTGVQTIVDSLLSESGTVVTVNGDLNVTGATTLGTPLAVTSGGTGANSAAGARSNLGAAASGANSDITSLSGLTTALSVIQGGTGVGTLAANGVLLGNGTSAVSSLVAGGAGLCLVSGAGAPSWQACPGSGGVASVNGLTGALTIANASTSGSTITIDDASTSQKGIAQFNATNFSASGGVINTAQDINVTAAPQFGRLTLTSSQATNPMLLVNNTNGAASGNLIDLQLNGVSRLSVTPAGAMTLSGTINGQTISSAANLTGTLAVAGAASLNGGASVTGTLTANTITPTGALTVGATTQSFTLQGNASSTLTANSGANTTTMSFQAPTANVTYRLLTAAAGTYDICTTVGNCAGVGGGVTTSGGTTNRIAKFTGSQAIADSIISDDGSTVTVGGTLAVNTITPSAAMTVGSTGQTLTLQGSSTSLSSTSGGITNSLTFATPSGSNKTITLPDATGTVAVSATGPLQLNAAGQISCPTCVTSGGGSGGVGAVDSLNGLTGTLSLANASGSGATITIDDASTSQKGIAQFNGTNFTASGGIVNTIQDINTTAAPQFGRLTVTSSQATNDMMTINNTNAGGTGSLLKLQLNGADRFTVDPAGNVVANGTLTSGAINGQTISSTASFTGTLAVAGNITTSATLNANAIGVTTNANISGTTSTGALSVTNNAGVGGNLDVTGSIATNTITNSGALTIGNTAQSFTLQGSAASTITATDSGNTTGLSFQTPTANVTYRLLTAAAGTYDVCTTAGNCPSGVTGSGTNGKIAKFTGSGSLGDSILTESGSTITVAGNMNLASGNQYQINGTQISSSALSNDSNLAKLNASQTFTNNNTFQSSSATGFLVQTAASAAVLTVDTSAARVMVGAGTATEKMDVIGNVKVRDAATATKSIRQRTNGLDLDFEAAGDKIQFSTWSAADFTGTQYNQFRLNADGTPIDFQRAIDLVNAVDGDVALKVTGTATQTADIFQVKANASAVLMAVNPTGATTLKNSANSTAAFQVQNASSTALFTVDSSNARLYVGPTAGDTTGALLVLGNKTNSGDPSGVNGGIYYNSSTHQFRCYRGINGTAADGAWENCGVNPIDRGFVLEDEFMSGDMSSGNMGDLGWADVSFGSGSCTYIQNSSTGPATSADHPGIVRCVTAAASNTGSRMYLGGNDLGALTLAAGNVIKTSVAVGNTSGTNANVLRVGADTAFDHNASTNSGIWWEADPSASANWRYCYATGGAATCAASGTAIAANTFVSLEIRITATGSGTSAADFFINGTKSSVSGVTIGTGAQVDPMFNCFTKGATARNCYIDYYQYRGIASARR